MEGRTFLDPSAQEFHPQFTLPIPQIYIPYPSSLSQPPPPPPPPPPAPAPADSPTRAVLLSLLPPHATEPLVRASMQLFGGIRAVEANCDSTCTVHFFDLRGAEAAVAESRSQYLRWQQSPLPPPLGPHDGRGLVGGHPVWAQFVNTCLDSPNQGSLFVFSSVPVSADEVRDIFQGFGSIMEVRESPTNPHRKFIEYFDVRDSARALEELNSKEVYGIRLLVEFSRPGGQSQARLHKRSHHNFTVVPPRLRSASIHSQSSSSSAGSTGAGAGSGNRTSDQNVAILKRNDAKIRNVARNGNAGTGMRRNKGSSSNTPSSAPSSSSRQPSSSLSSSKQQQQQQRSNKKGWKNYPKNHGDSRFVFKEVELTTESAVSAEAATSSCSSRDSRTTVMIKNIPNKYSQKLLLNMLDNHCIHCNEQIGGEEEPLSAYDFVYLPIDFNNKCNVGYGFVNMTSPEATVRLYKAFHNQPWEVFNSRKICQVTYARLQGLEALKDHFKNSKFACDNDEYMPVAFSPPRDGKLLTEPAPVGGRCSFRSRGSSTLGGASSTTTTSTHAPSDQADDADGDGGRDETQDDDGLREQFLHLSCN